MIRFLFVVTDVFNITGRGKIASGRELWRNGKIKPSSKFFLLNQGKAPVPFVSHCIEEYMVFGGIPCSIGIPDDLEDVGAYSYIVVIEDD